MKDLPQILVIFGPTASGKSNLAVKLASLFNGEVISADSRQVYKGLDIGTGKITPSEMNGIPHHLLDILLPQENFSVVQWRNLAEKAITGILNKGKLPIICGGTGYYISSLTENLPFPSTDPDFEAQQKLEQKTAPELLAELAAVNPAKAAIMSASPSESANKRRLARAILVARNNVPAANEHSTKKYNFIKIGLKLDDQQLKTNIIKRLHERIEAGMIDEARNLHTNGLSYERMEAFGLEYRYLAKYLKGNIEKSDMEKQLATKIWQYAKRQKTWLKRDEIRFFEPGQIEDIISYLQHHLTIT